MQRLTLILFAVVIAGFVAFAAHTAYAGPSVGTVDEQSVTAGNDFDETADSGLFRFSNQGSGIIRRLVFYRTSSESINLYWKLSKTDGTDLISLRTAAPTTITQQVITLELPISANEMIELKTSGATQAMNASVLFEPARSARPR